MAILTSGIAPPSGRRKFRWRRIVLIFSAMLIVLIGTFLAIGGWGLIKSAGQPDLPFESMSASPAPDYSQAASWLAFPGRNGLERSAPPGFVPIEEAEAPADVFFIHPTTFRGNQVWNVPFDASFEEAVLKPPVLLQQASVFNGCCRIYAPQYRQATLAGLNNDRAFALAYSDVARAFRYYIKHYNKGRPYIIASHSQGTGHANRLMQEEILGNPLRSRIVAAYMIGGYVPDTFADIGLPVCSSARQTGCVISYNASQSGRSGARIIINSKKYWWQGKMVENGQSDAVCVNPLTWTQTGEAAPHANPGSHQFPKPPFPNSTKSLSRLVRNLTGARCRRGMLEVDIPWSTRSGFSDALSIFFGSHHLNDYGLFYSALRENAIERVQIFNMEHVSPKQPNRSRYR